ncbi:hypothetical protein ADIS_2244 [Lunatimonas lonarensis]|uniref:Uncharacterized protein n=1 Tax=Lunatimonas lonarensis TaxID=1232681 RepID=R7ZT97_9BACT|nr:hypothetical protein ADIS_2244 [Lunatimonas lonarensis]
MTIIVYFLAFPVLPRTDPFSVGEKPHESKSLVVGNFMN